MKTKKVIFIIAVITCLVLIFSYINRSDNFYVGDQFEMVSDDINFEVYRLAIDSDTLEIDSTESVEPQEKKKDTKKKSENIKKDTVVKKDTTNYLKKIMNQQTMIDSLLMEKRKK